MGVVKPVTLNDIGADVKVPETWIVWSVKEHEPVKSINELQESELMIKLFAKVSHKLEGIRVESDGSKVTLRETEVSKVVGKN